MKNLKKVLALVLAVVMIMGVVTVASAKTYKDADAEAFKNYADAIDALSSLNILDGFEDGEFKADRTFNRAQAAKIVAIVHNAATNGKIKGQDAISALYSNAQNPFVDCNTSWALPYINYCRITGLADGMTATTYAPKRELTGVQWLKLMLTTLNFDTAKEGYTGTGWDVNVLNRANEVGLTAGLADGWKAIAPIKRGEAAQILYNALTKYLVEYGQKVKNNYVDDKTLGKYYNYSFISNEQVAKSGYTLGGKMGISITRTTDSFRRPGYTWSYGSWAAFYMDKPLNSYTTAVTACDILKNDIGIAETSTKTVELNGHVNGEIKTSTADGAWANTYATELKVDDKATKGTALNYFAVDGHKFAYGTGVEAGITLQHKKDKSCQTIGVTSANTETNWQSAQFGGQGDLTQVFETEDGYVITVIHTFLAKVTAVNLNNKYSHATAENAEVKVWLQMQNDVPAYSEEDWTTGVTQMKAVSTVDYAKGTMVLVNLSLKKNEMTNRTGYYTANANVADDNTAKATIVGAADAKTGKLTGASDINYVETVSIDGTKYNTNCRFVLGKDAAMNIKNDGKTYTFYFDSYGNVIGRTANTTAASYVIMDRIYATHENGKFAIKADLVDLEGKSIEGATVAAAGSFAFAKDAYDNTGNYSAAWNYPNDNMIYVVSKHNDGNLVNSLYSYTTDANGVYTLTWVGDATSAGTIANQTNAAGTVTVTYGAAYARLNATFTHTAKMAYIRLENLIGNLNKATTDKVLSARATASDANGYDLSVSESTKFIVKSAGGEWTTYTGYTALPALTASYVDYLDNDGDGYADIVYIGGAVFAADNVTGWVLTWKVYNWANGYDVITVYVDGEPVYVNVDHATYVAHKNDSTGLYTFTTKVDENGVTYSDFVKANETVTNFSGRAVESCSADASAIKIEMSTGYTETVSLTDVVIYNVLADGTVAKADASCIVAGDLVVYSKVANRYNAPYAVIYVLDQTIPYNP